MAVDQSILDHFVVIPESAVVPPPRALSEHALFAVPESVRALEPVAEALYKYHTRDIDFPIFLDNSMFQAFSLCKYKGWMSYMRNIAAAGINIHLHFGGAFAKGLETVRLSFYAEGKHLDDAITDGLVAMWRTWGTYVPAKPTPKTIDRLECALIAYFNHWDPRTDYLQPYIGADKRPAVEFTFAVPIPGTRHPQTNEEILFVGRFDLLAQFAQDAYRGALFVDDEKTSTSLGPQWRDQWHLSSQMTGYTWASRTYGLPVAGAMVRGIGILKTEIKLDQVITMRDEWAIQRWLDRVRAQIAEMIECWQTRSWPQVLNAACGMYGGCTYRLLCEHQNPEDWLEGNYRHHVWNPLDKDDPLVVKS